MAEGRVVSERPLPYLEGDERVADERKHLVQLVGSQQHVDSGQQAGPWGLSPDDERGDRVDLLGVLGVLASDVAEAREEQVTAVRRGHAVHDTHRGPRETERDG